MKDGYHVYRSKKEFLKIVHKMKLFQVESEYELYGDGLAYFKCKNDEFIGWCYKHNCDECYISCPITPKEKYRIIDNVYFHNSREEKLKRILK